MKKTYIEVDKPASLKGINYPLFYMYANGLDTHDGKPIYCEIVNDNVLDIAYKNRSDEVLLSRGKSSNGTKFKSGLSEDEILVYLTKRIVKNKENIMNHVEKYWWVIEHPKLTNKYDIQPSIEFTPQMVNPVDNAINADKVLNTKSEWWIEVDVAHKGFDPKADWPSDGSFKHTHDWDLDCGGDTIEEAIDTMYNLVKEKYGDYECEE